MSDVVKLVRMQSRPEDARELTDKQLVHYIDFCGEDTDRGSYENLLDEYQARVKGGCWDG